MRPWRAFLGLISVDEFGSTPELLLDTQQATIDEIEHTQLAYGMASAYKGEDIGPAPFNLGGMTIETDPAQALRALLEEACVGEILGAAEAQVASECATDPVVKAVYARIADEEGRHARLAWQSLQWMLEQRPELRSQAVEWLNEIVAEHMNRRSMPTPHRPEIGLIGATERQAIFEDALMTVVLPCAEGLGLQLKAVV